MFSVCVSKASYVITSLFYSVHVSEPLSATLHTSNGLGYKTTLCDDA